jgi:hypothetical protein
VQPSGFYLRLTVRHVRKGCVGLTIYTVLHTMIDGYQSYVPFWLHGVAGAKLRPDTH